MTFDDSAHVARTPGTLPISRVRLFAMLGLLLVVAPAAGRAEVTRIEITTREDVLNVSIATGSRRHGHSSSSIATRTSR